MVTSTLVETNGGQDTEKIGGTRTLYEETSFEAWELWLYVFT